jgi:hypothetical protein
MKCLTIKSSIMKKIISLSAILTFLLFSYKKDETDIPIGTLKVDINSSAVSRCNSSGCVFGVDSVIIAGTFKGDY